MPIVPATSADRPSIVDLLSRVGLPHDDLSNNLLSHFCVLRTNGVVQGTVGLEPVERAALLRSLAVHPNVRGQGHGTALVQAAEAHARTQNLHTLYLLTTTAAPFFRDRGYTPHPRNAVPSPIAQTDEFSRLCPDSAVCMQKSLIS
ncbi:hypothetical protein BSZ35_07525 [Salinibacter sp. 10B]|uniref:arsenic resistance N-acetyltransferase ArsN2 n=1 Tax=Salinibacter sp. 10B TaxID=1923971 RepID=UPI000CF4D737|nr:arsenic resistance N-acetyltransferase ArsN2 [Salinibacter sp. 10B]PQJ34468.1 hypothetical protein BSZ35_07525 [Salinibacter sp. 10B]